MGQLRSTRITLFVGFGSLLLLMGLAGVGAIQVLRRIQGHNDRIRSQFLFRNHVLNEVRSKLYLSGTYVRDYLLEPDAQIAETHRSSLDRVKRDMEAALQSYERQLGPEEAAPYTALHKELFLYWQTLEPIGSWSGEQRKRQGYIFLRDDVFPRRTSMLNAADQITVINEQQLDAGNARLADLFVSFQTRLVGVLMASLLLGMAMAAFSTQKILKLERDAEVRYHEIEQAQAELKNLSARLVQTQETERKTISRELHDEVGQALSAALVEMRNLTNGIAGHAEKELREHIEVIRGLLENCVKVVRNMALLLRPSMLDDLGLVSALDWQAREVSKRTSLDVSVATELISDDLPDQYKTAIYRIVQEALHNSSRHANATTVRVRVKQEPGQLRLSVQDDGKGFNPERTKGLGLIGIQERVASLGGTFQVHSEPGQGTLLTVELPFTKEANVQSTTSTR